MCDYSLHTVSSRPAKVGDRLVTTEFAKTVTRGFASVDDPTTAVCLSAGAELVFDAAPQYSGGFMRWLRGTRPTEINSMLARFRQIHREQYDTHHDALEFADGTVVLLTRLCPGQQATVLQLAATPKKTSTADRQLRPVDGAELAPAI